MFQSRVNPTCLYKYLQPKWADDMIRTGSMHIGTLGIYREIEAKDAERGDVGEGTRILHSDDQPRVYNSTEELPPVFQGISCGPRGLATNGPNAIVIENRISDAYIYCVTETFDSTVMNNFGGACIRIEQPIAFFNAVNEGVRAWLQGHGLSVCEGVLDQCVYVTRHQNFHAAVPVHECFLKPPQYQHQREVRAVWQPDKLPINPIPLECLPAAQYCERHA